MPEPLRLVGGPAPAVRTRESTYRAMLRDTHDLLSTLKYATREDERAAQAQAEAITQILKD